MRVQHSGASYRGLSVYPQENHGTGGNQTVNAQTGSVPGNIGVGDWHPTVLYLLGLLVVEWAVFLALTKYL